MKIAKLLQGFYRWVKTWVKSESVSENVGEKKGFYSPFSSKICLKRMAMVTKQRLVKKERNKRQSRKSWNFRLCRLIDIYREIIRSGDGDRADRHRSHADDDSSDPPGTA